MAQRRGVAGRAARLPGRATASCGSEPSVKQLGGTDLKRLHRELAPAGPTAGSRCSSTTCRRRSTSGRSCAPRRRCGSTTCGSAVRPRFPATSAPATHRARHRAVPDLGRRRRTAGGRRRGEGRPATGWSASSWPTAPSRSTRRPSATMSASSFGHEDRGLSAGLLAACDTGGLHPAARSGRVAQRRQRRRHRHVRDPAEALGGLSPPNASGRVRVR